MGTDQSPAERHTEHTDRRRKMSVKDLLSELVNAVEDFSENLGKYESLQLAAAISTHDAITKGFALVAEAIKNNQPPPPPGLIRRGYASVITDAGFIAKGDITMSRITTSGWAEYKFQPVDKRGNPTTGYQTGTARHTIVNDDGTLATIVASALEPDNELAFRVNAVGKPGAVQLLSTVDGDPSADVERTIEASGAVEIVPGDAVRGDLVEGSTGEQE